MNEPFEDPDAGSALPGPGSPAHGPDDPLPPLSPSPSSAPDPGADVPRLPGGFTDQPAIAARPSGSELGEPIQPPVVPPMPLAPPHPVSSAVPDGEFAPLRADPPPLLLPTLWLRLVLFFLLIASAAATMFVEYNGEPDDLRSSQLVIGVHLGAAGALMLWSYLAMQNAYRLVPATQYQTRSRGWLAVVLWLLAFGAPVGAVAVERKLRERLDDPDDMQALFIMVLVVLIAFVLLWLPFRYHARQAARIGAPPRAMLVWFFAPLLAAIGGLAMVSLGLGEMLAEEGLTADERTLQVGVVHGLPMFLFALCTWRAVAVFDEVIDLRWRRWRAEWEQTLEAFAAQPPPGPEDSPDISTLEES